MDKRLKKSGVLFNEEDHTYMLDGKELFGITSMIRRHIFPDKFAGVPKRVLDARADYGHRFHKEMELYINTGIESSSDAFNVFKEHYKDKIKFIASEYIVTDYKRYASPIDAVDSNMVLYDFKTTSQPDMEYWRWQMSVYSYLFGIVNGYYPSGLKVLWINKDMKHGLFDIEPLKFEEVEALLEADAAGELYTPKSAESVLPAGVVTDERLAAMAAIEGEIVRRETELKSIKAEYDDMKSAILKAFMQHGITKWETDVMRLTVKAPYERTTIDSKMLKEEYPDIYSNVTKTSTVKESLIVKLK